MFRKSNSILIKAVAMGTLLTSGGIATDGDENKESKKLDAPLYGSTTHGGTTETGLPSVGTENRDVHRSLVEPLVRNILSRVDEQLEMCRDLLKKPIKVDLRGAAIRGVQPIDKVVNTLLADAKKYNVPLKLILLNATETELNDILSHQDANYIQEVDWTYEMNLMEDMNAYDLTEISDNNTEEWVDDPLILTATDEPDEEWIDEFLTLTANELDEKWIDDPAALIKGNGPYTGLPRFRRAAAARAMHPPLLPELVETLGQKGVVAPPKRVVDTSDSLDIGNDKIHTSAWNITLVKDAEGQKDPNSQGLGQFNNLTNHVPHNLVHIFCRENRAQA